MTSERFSEEGLWVDVQEAPVDVARAFAFLQTPHAGGLSVFAGTTRQWTDGVETVRLEYEGYRPMALAEMRKIAGEAAEAWPLLKACLVHRLGVVPAGEASVVVGVAAAHRAEAFEACRFLIDTLKTRVPIWKREVYRDGHTEWVEGTAPPVK